jgi:hypothetical protein
MRWAILYPMIWSHQSNTLPDQEPVRDSLNVGSLVECQSPQLVASGTALFENLGIVATVRILPDEYCHLSTRPFPTRRPTGSVVTSELAHDEGGIGLVGSFVRVRLVEAGRGDVFRDCQCNVWV